MSFTIKTKTKLIVARVKFIGFRLFLVTLGGVIGASGVFVSYEAPKLIQSETVTFYNASIVQTVEAKQVEAIEVVSEWKTAEFSAYTASVSETDASPLIMASGKMVYLGAVACPRSIDLGEKIEIKGLGVYTCEDRMNIRYTNNFDIFMLTKAEALKFGRQTMKYKIIK
jgi:3D (Asp-Asp-Asp) domain-containing protein